MDMLMLDSTAPRLADAPAVEVADRPEPFAIAAAASLPERRPRTLKHGDTFGVFGPTGDALDNGVNPEGLFHRDTRYLSRLLLTMQGARPLLLSSTLRDDNAALTCDLTNPDLYDDAGRLLIAHDQIHLRRSRFIYDGACYERLAVRNFAGVSYRVQLTLNFAADFADLFEVRGMNRRQRGRVLPPVVGAATVSLSYIGLDEVQRTTRLRFDPPPASLSGTTARFELELAPGAAQAILIVLQCDGHQGDVPVRAQMYGALRQTRRQLRRLAGRRANVTTSNEIFNEAVGRSAADVDMLITETPEGPYPYAGIPWFSTVFGRDALITALEMLWLNPSIARGVLAHLAANQAADVDADADAEPGKILHEVRRGEMAELGEIPFRRYYGSIDSTPLFVMLAGAYLDRSGDAAFARSIWPNLERALDWIDGYGDRDGDGFIEYGRRTSEGLINQGWKDSYDSVFHADGTLAQGPIALVEVQAYVYGAWRAAARIAQSLGQDSRATEFVARAEDLRRRFDAAFFDEELGTFVLALDGDKRPCRIRTSNAGHALFSGIAYPERCAAVAAGLMAPDSFSGWGIRTAATVAARYNPLSYHNGSVWPHDNALIAAGLSRYGFRREAGRIFEGLFAASTYIELRRLPELFCGFARRSGNGPTSYPVACSPQAWAAAAPFSLLQSCLGLRLDEGEGQVRFEQPFLPSFLDEITLRRLSLPQGSVDVALRRVGGEVAVNVLARNGNIRVITTS